MSVSTTPKFRWSFCTDSRRSHASSLRRIIFADSLGTLFEWYDFYLYGSLAVFFGGLFLSLCA